jgi:hypothetical protein
MRYFVIAALVALVIGVSTALAGSAGGSHAKGSLGIRNGVIFACVEAHGGGATVGDIKLNHCYRGFKPIAWTIRGDDPGRSFLRRNAHDHRRRLTTRSGGRVSRPTAGGWRNGEAHGLRRRGRDWRSVHSERGLSGSLHDRRDACDPLLGKRWPCGNRDGQRGEYQYEAGVHGHWVNRSSARGGNIGNIDG